MAEESNSDGFEITADKNPEVQTIQDSEQHSAPSNQPQRRNRRSSISKFLFSDRSAVAKTSAETELAPVKYGNKIRNYVRKKSISVFDEYDNSLRENHLHNIKILGKVHIQLHRKANEARRWLLTVILGAYSPYLIFVFHLDARNVKQRKYALARIIFLPDSLQRVSWDIMLLIIVIYSSFEVKFPCNLSALPFPILSLFCNQSSNASPQIPFSLIFVGASCQSDWTSRLDLAIDSFFLADILTNFNSAYVNDLGVTVRDHSKIARKYLRYFLPAAGPIGKKSPYKSDGRKIRFETRKSKPKIPLQPTPAVGVTWLIAAEPRRRTAPPRPTRAAREDLAGPPP